MDQSKETLEELKEFRSWSASHIQDADLHKQLLYTTIALLVAVVTFLFSLSFFTSGFYRDSFINLGTEILGSALIYYFLTILVEKVAPTETFSGNVRKISKMILTAGIIFYFIAYLSEPLSNSSIPSPDDFSIIYSSLDGFLMFSDGFSMVSPIFLNLSTEFVGALVIFLILEPAFKILRKIQEKESNSLSRIDEIINHMEINRQPAIESSLETTIEKNTQESDIHKGSHPSTKNSIAKWEKKEITEWSEHNEIFKPIPFSTRLAAVKWNLSFDKERPIFGVNRIPFHITLTNKHIHGFRLIPAGPSGTNRSQEIGPAIKNVTSAYILVSAARTKRILDNIEFIGKRIGFLEFKFEDKNEEIYKVPLILSDNIRDMKLGDLDAINWFSSNNLEPIWRKPDDSITIDMLKVEFPDKPRNIAHFQYSVQIEDIPPNFQGVLPIIRIFGLTYQVQPSSKKTLDASSDTKLPALVQREEADSDVNDSISLKNTDLLAIKSTLGIAVVKIENKSNAKAANYSWRYKENDLTKETSGNGELYEQYGKVYEINDREAVVEDVGGKLHMNIGPYNLEWSYSSESYCWVYKQDNLSLSVFELTELDSFRL